MSKYAKSLLKDFINFAFIFHYLNSVYDYKNNARSKHLPITLLDFDLDLDLHFFSPHLQTFQLNLISLNKASKLF